MKGTVLIVAAHPDDELLGCGGTVCQLVKAGCRVVTLILGEGITSREQFSQQELLALRKNALSANKAVGISEVFLEQLPDNRFDSLPLLEIVKKIEKMVAQVSPDIIFTHFEHDLNVDHRLTYQAVMTACRPQPKFKYPDIYSFEIPSSTDWNQTSQEKAFIPNIFVNIKGEIRRKIKALSYYKSEIKPYPHSRSLKSIRLLAQFRGVAAGLEYAEAFRLVRSIRQRSFT